MQDHAAQKHPKRKSVKRQRAKWPVDTRVRLQKQSAKEKQPRKPLRSSISLSRRQRERPTGSKPSPWRSSLDQRTQVFLAAGALLGVMGIAVQLFFVSPNQVASLVVANGYLPLLICLAVAVFCGLRLLLTAPLALGFTLGVVTVLSLQLQHVALTLPILAILGVVLVVLTALGIMLHQILG